jgi:hypothetical protein
MKLDHENGTGYPFRTVLPVLCIVKEAAQVELRATTVEPVVKAAAEQ